MPQNVVRHEGEHLYATQPSTPEGRRLSEAILALRRAERVQAERALRASGLSNLDLTALRYLVQGYRDGRDLSPKDVIVMLDTSSATVTNVIERLVQRGFVTRVQHPTDRRAHYLVPTEAAIRRVDDSYAAHHSTVVTTIEGLSPEDAETAATVITRIAEALDRLAHQAVGTGQGEASP
ncbi:MarR family winged helix-turn-helix transcriptional regulator [Microbacterium sp. B2969]|uniref:MarR family winged helix-turn-helix transcriptional regulator n=1 Tax=Microbacterium alkaliflavum TaxID=3248839 RepID=A0ABW7QEE1_9MICO